jgi:hypothetical protein
VEDDGQDVWIVEEGPPLREGKVFVDIEQSHSDVGVGRFERAR